MEGCGSGEDGGDSGSMIENDGKQQMSDEICLRRPRLLLGRDDPGVGGLGAVARAVKPMSTTPKKCQR